MNHIASRKIESWSNLSLTCLLRMSLLIHQFITSITKLNACSRMYGIIYTGMKWLKTSEHLIIGSIDDDINLQAGDVTLPDVELRV